MLIIETILSIAQVIIVGVIAYYFLKILSKRKYWSWWEKFFVSKEFIPMPPILEFSPESKIQALKFLKIIGYAFLVLIILILIQYLLIPRDV